MNEYQQETDWIYEKCIWLSNGFYWYNSKYEIIQIFQLTNE